MAVDKKNILLIGTETSYDYAGNSLRVDKKYPIRSNILAHAKRIKSKIEECYERNQNVRSKS